MLLSQLILALNTIKTNSGDIEVIDAFHNDTFELRVADGFLVLCYIAAGQPTES